MVRWVSLWMCAAVLTAAVAGCASSEVPEAVQPGTSGVRLLAMTAYEPEASGGPGVVRAFVQPIGANEAAEYRFELYEFVPLNANPRGKRLVLWPGIEPGAAQPSNPYWRGHLKAYEFVLPMSSPPAAKKTYLLEVTSLGKDGTRRNDIMKLKSKEQ